MELAAGTLINDKVRLLRPLGAGGMGTVWLAHHGGLDAEVAVKLLARERSESERTRRRFEREASLAARIESPHVVRIFDHGVAADGTPYIVMERLVGRTLTSRLESDGPFDLDRCAELVTQLCLALDAAHSIGVVHRDIKPANIFLTDAGYELFVKVLDFGVAKQQGQPAELTHTGARIGTPHYMSPEQLRCAKHVDHRADLWAVAVVAYRALTGRVPFTGPNLGALAVVVSEGRFAPPSALCPLAGPELDSWFKLALCRRISARPASARQLAESFAAAARASRLASAPPARRPGSIDEHGPTESGTADAVPTRIVPPSTISRPVARAAVEPSAPDGAPRRAPRWRTGAVVLAAGTALGIGWLLARASGRAPVDEEAQDRAAPPLAAGAVAASDELPGTAATRAAAPAAAPGSPSGADADRMSPRATALPSSPLAAAGSAGSRAPRSVAPTARPQRSGVPDCGQPFVIDEHGDLHPKPGCLR